MENSLTGGSGADTFIFTSMAAGQSASITDFNNGADVLDLRSLGATSISISGSIVTATIAGGTVAINTHAMVTAGNILWAAGSGEP